jgi:hypothetical protein
MNQGVRTPALQVAALALVVVALGGCEDESRDALELSVEDWEEARADRRGDREFLKPPGAPAGRWREARTLEEKIDELEGIGYAAGYEPAPVEVGVTVHREGVSDGYNLLVSGHGPEAVLVDMDGKELHRWRCPFADALPDFVKGKGTREQYRDFWRRAHLYPNGDLLAIFEGHGMVKLDAASNVLWRFQKFPHHDLDVLDDGRIFVLTRKASIVPRIHETEPVLEDFVTILSPHGKVQQKVSILECFEGSEFEYMLERTEPRGDFFHTNTIEVLDGRLADRHPAFAAGNVLVSVLRLDTICILDLEAKRVVWALSEGWVEQHQPTVTDDGQMMVFDNLGGDAEFGRTRVMQFDPIDYRLTWLYEGTADNHFQSDTCGSIQRFSNGNTLITESDNGRAFEVNEAKEIVWEFISPFRAGDDGELIATLFDVVRMPPDFPVDWARGGQE